MVTSYRQPRRQNLSVQERLRQIGLIGYWPLANAVGVDLNSAFSPSGPDDFSNINAVTSVTGPSGNLPSASGFNSASSQYLRSAAATNPRLDGLSSFTLAGWYYQTTNTVNVIFSRWDLGSTPNQKQVALTHNNGTISLNASQNGSSNGTAGTATGITTATWYFLICESRDGVLSIYVNLAPGATLGLWGGTGGGLWPSTVRFNFGAQFNNGSAISLLNGKLAHWGIWSRVLRDDEKFWLYNNGNGRDLVRGV
jgi:hypothetical protein